MTDVREPEVVTDDVTITIDGQELPAKKGELLIKVAQDHGIFIPRFCWHERMKPVGMCRMCLVEVEGVRGLPPACTTTVTDGMVVNFRKDNVKKAQDGVLEFLLINHPLDCPVCDRGGECPLQDQTLAFGPGESRFVEEKRHFEKPVPISDLVFLDRERCIQCARCTRFADEIAGDPLIDFGDRGDETKVITYPDEPFTSYFSGNTVQICPVGALTASAYRFSARPWDLATSETSCLTCSVGCRGALQSSSNRLVRLLGVDSEPVNHGWLCDKGRYGYEYVHSSTRTTDPAIRTSGHHVPASWPEALDAAAAGLRKVREIHGPAAIAVIGGARGTNEDAYAWARFAKGVLGTDNVDAQIGDGLPADVVLGMPRATISDLDRAAAIVLAGPDLKEELPVLFLRVRRAAEELGVPLIDCSARDHGLTRYADAVLRHRPGDLAATAAQLAGALTGDASGDTAIDAAARLVEGRDGPIVVILGRPSLAESAGITVDAAAALLRLGDRVRFLSALRRGNVHGALDLGLTPGFLPGRVSLDAGREHFTGAWGAVPERVGLDTEGILRGAVDGTVRALVILGSNPIADFPDQALARRALEQLEFIVAVGAFVTDTSRHANVLLPTALWGEKAGTATNLEGRVQRVSQQVSAEGTAMVDWRIAGELAFRLGVDFDLETVEEIQDEIARVAPAFAGVGPRLVRLARDGVVLPLAEHADELVLGPGHPAPAGSDLSWEPIRPQVASEETHLSSLGTGVVEASGTGSSTTIKPGLTENPAEPVSEEEADEIADAAGAVLAAHPPLHRWTGAAPGVAPVPADSYSLRLVVGRKLYDAGLIVSQSPSLAPLAPGSALFVNPTDLNRIGVPDGTEVRVISSLGAVQLPVRADAATAVGTAFVPFNQPGSGEGGVDGAASLIDVTQSVTDLRVETLG